MNPELALRIANAYAEFSEFCRGGAYPESQDGRNLLLKSAQYGRDGQVQWMLHIAERPATPATPADRFGSIFSKLEKSEG